MKKALVIGIDHYPAPNQLHACVNDATEMAKLLRENEDGTPNFDCLKLVSSERVVTKALAWEHIEQLFQLPGTSALLYFSGHGSQDLLSGYLVTQDATRWSEGIELQRLLRLVNDSLIPEIVIIIDCCYSGNFGNAGNPGVAGQNLIELKEGRSILTASMGHQVSIERYGHGVFTRIVLNSLRGAAKDLFGTVTVAGIYNRADQAFRWFEQRPMLKCHVSRMAPMRQCRPNISREELRQIVHLFTQPDFFHQMDKSYEITEKAYIKEENVAKFDLFKKYRDAGLLRPEGAVDLYWAAMFDKGCVLTEEGQYYWELVKRGVI